MKNKQWWQLLTDREWSYQVVNQDDTLEYLRVRAAMPAILRARASRLKELAQIEVSK